jgi:predicted dehydrogenase
VGLGQLAREVHLPNLASLPGVSITALADPSAEARSRAAGEQPHAPVVESLEKLLESRSIDAVLIATPTADHARHAGLSIEARVPFYLEKPLASDIAEAFAVCEAAESARVPAMMGFSYRFHPAISRLQGSVAGAMRVQSRFTIAPRELPAWKRTRATGGGVLLDLGIHHFDLLPLLLRSRVESLEARIWSERTEQDCAEVQLRFESGAEASCLFSFCRDESDVMTFTGPHGRTTHNRYAPLEYPLWPVTRFISYVAERRRSPWKEVSFRRSLAAWVHSVRTGEEPPVSLRDGLASLEIVHAAEQSAARGGATVRIGQTREAFQT